jgi:hypothetical protein
MCRDKAKALEFMTTSELAALICFLLTTNSTTVNSSALLLKKCCWTTTGLKYGYHKSKVGVVKKAHTRFRFGMQDNSPTGRCSSDAYARMVAWLLAGKT